MLEGNNDNKRKSPQEQSNQRVIVTCVDLNGLTSVSMVGINAFSE